MKRYYVASPAGLAGPYQFASDARAAARMCGGCVVADESEPSEEEKACQETDEKLQTRTPKGAK